MLVFVDGPIALGAEGPKRGKKLGMKKGRREEARRRDERS